MLPLNDAKRKYKRTAKGKEVRKRYNRAYYARTSTLGILPRRAFDQYEDTMILEHKIPDRELSDKLLRSMRSIQTRRSKLKKEMRGSNDKE